MPIPLTFLQGPWKLSMGLNLLDPADWLWLDEHHAAQTAQRAALAADRPDEVHAMLPEAAEAARELQAMVCRYLERHHPGLAAPMPAADVPPLMALAGLAQEDFCVVQQRQPDGRYVLTGAILCFPAHWRLREKLGRSLAEIHGPVPGFEARLGRPVDRFFQSLEPERPVWRANWSLVEDTALFHPHGRAPIPDLTPANAGRLLWLRVERQTLRRLPESRAVVFTIRTLIEPLTAIARQPGLAQALAARLREMDPAMAAYKGLVAVGEPVLAYLDRMAEEAGPAVA